MIAVMGPEAAVNAVYYNKLQGLSDGERDVGKGVNFYSLDEEIALGKQLAGEVLRSAKIVNDPIISEYVNRVGYKWSLLSPRGMAPLQQ